MGIDIRRINEDRLYRTRDEILPTKQALGEHLKQRYGELFASRFDLLLYDMTSTYFEGEAKANPQAPRGYSRDSRPDCNQVTIAGVATEEGLPLFYEVFDGNRTDGTTVEEIVEEREELYGRAHRIWVMDRAIVKRFEKRIEARREKLKRQVERGRLKRASGIERRIGKILGQNPRAESLFEVTLEENKTPRTLRIEKNEIKRRWAELSEGCYLLRTNYRDEKDPKDLWKTYIQLTEVEETFRMLKTEMRIRPIFHQTQKRVQAPIFVSFLALVMYRTLSQWMQAVGLGNSPRKLIEELAQIRSMDVILPLQEGPELRLRCVSPPEKSQQILLDRLKIYPPRRINRIKNVVPTSGVSSS